jgi:N4-gp56 family major capsid protein
MLQWQFDAPTGTYKQHALSQHLYEAAFSNAVFTEHVTPIKGFGRKQGENVTLTRIKQITEPTTGALTEGQRIPEDTMTLSTVSITVSEFGRSVPYTSLLDDLSFFDVENQVQKLLRTQMTLTMDTAAATAFKTAKVKYVPTGLTSNNITTNGTAGAAATANLNLYHVEQIRDYMFDTLFTPMINGEYIGIFRTLGLRGLKQDPAWEEWHKYTDPQAKYNNEIGKIEGVRFIECNHSNALGKVGTSSVLGEGVVFGEDAVAMAEVLTPELRAGIPADFGRSKAVAWYGIFQYGIIWDTGNAGEARIVHVTST